VGIRHLRFWVFAAAVACAPAALSAQDVMTMPVRTVDARPTYTPEAARARIAGVVVLTVDVLPDGMPSNPKIVKSLDATFGLDQKAIEAVLKWRFTPGTRNGVPVTMRVTASLNFVLRDRDGTTYGAPLPTPPPPTPPPSAWPLSFANEIADAGATWKPDSVKLGDTTLNFESPAGWSVRNYPQGNLLLAMMSGDGRRAVMTGAAMKTPGPMMLPLPAERVDGFGKTMATMPTLKDGKLLASGQVQVGTQWWLWLEITPSSDTLNQMPPEMREALTGHDFSEMRLWSFVTGHDSEMVQIMLYDWLPETAADRDAELKSATSVFRVILSKMTFAK
jgi:TonB family protein